MSRAYYTGSDASIKLLNHPETKFRGTVDAAFFALQVGDNPTHIWNYARRENQSLGPNDNLAQFGISSDIGQGGSLFDDTALGVHTCQLQLILNAERFKEVRYAFAPHTRIGDVQIAYSGVAQTWQPASIERVGYRLINGHIAQAGEEISLQNGIYPTISIQFERAEPLVDGRIPVFRESGLIDRDLTAEQELAEDQESVYLRLISYRVHMHQQVVTPFNGTFEQKMVYQPDRVPNGGFSPVITRIDPAIERKDEFTTRATSFRAWANEASYVGALIEGIDGNRRLIVVWDSLTSRYVGVAQSGSTDSSPIPNSILTGDNLTRVQTALLGHPDPT